MYFFNSVGKKKFFLKIKYYSVSETHETVEKILLLNSMQIVQIHFKIKTKINFKVQELFFVRCQKYISKLWNSEMLQNLLKSLKVFKIQIVFFHA